MAKQTITAGCDDSCAEPRKKAAARIFETARQLFYQRGVRAVGVDEIVCQAGVTKPSLYRSFESKDHLVAACLESFAEEACAELECWVARAGEDPLAQLRALVAYFADKMNRPGFRGCPMTNTAVEFPEDGHPGRAIVESCKLDIRDRFADMARRAGLEEPEGLADGLVLLIEGAYSAHQIFGSQGPATALLDSAERLIRSHPVQARSA